MSDALRRCLQRIARGPLPVGPIAELTADGSAVVIAVVVPLPSRAKPASAPVDATPRGRPAELPRAVLRWLQGHAGRHFSDILDAMAAEGHSRAQTADALAKLVRLGLVEHPARGMPYRAAV
jgi:hypothetical protein